MTFKRKEPSYMSRFIFYLSCLLLMFVKSQSGNFAKKKTNPEIRMKQISIK